METELLQWNFITITATLITPLIIFVFIINKRHKINAVNIHLPPGPKKLPIIGNLHLISEPPFRSLAHLAQHHGPIMHLKLGQVDAVVVSSAEIAKEVLKENDAIFVDRHQTIAFEIFWYNYANIIFSPYGDYWRQMRKICTVELLSTKSVRSFASIRQDEVSRLVEFVRLSAGKAVDLTEKVFSTMSAVTCRAAFGKVCKNKDLMTKLVTEGLEMGAGTSIADHFPSSKIASLLSWGSRVRLMRMRRKLDMILDDIIRQHEMNSTGNGEFGNEDLVDVLLRVKDSGELNFPIGYNNIKAVIFDMFAGGTETSSSTIDWTMTELVRNPLVMAKVQAEVRRVVKESGIEEEDVKKMEYLKAVIMETLRLHPQIPIIIRASRETCRVSEYMIPSKTRLLVNVWAIHRDPKNWTDPETYQPDRFLDQPSLGFTGSNFCYLPFGSGKRICPGVAFGWASVALPLAHLLYNFDWKLPEGIHTQALNMTESSGLTTYRKEKLLLVATPYHDLSTP